MGGVRGDKRTVGADCTDEDFVFAAGPLAFWEWLFVSNGEGGLGEDGGGQTWTLRLPLDWWFSVGYDDWGTGRRGHGG